MKKSVFSNTRKFQCYMQNQITEWGEILLQTIVSFYSFLKAYVFELTMVSGVVFVKWVEAGRILGIQIRDIAQEVFFLYAKRTFGMIST